MKISEVIGDNVVPFPTKSSNIKSQIDVPPGYSSFYVKDIGTNSAHIMGIKPDGKHVQISTTTRELAHILAKAYNQGGRSDVSITPVSLTQAFGSDVVKAFDDIGVKFVEKPESWEEIKRRASCSADQLKNVDQMVGGIAEVSPEELFGNSNPRHPLTGTDNSLPRTVVLAMPNDDQYVADRGGASSYFRFWLYIRPKALTLAK